MDELTEEQKLIMAESDAKEAHDRVVNKYFPASRSHAPGQRVAHTYQLSDEQIAEIQEVEDRLREAEARLRAFQGRP